MAQSEGLGTRIPERDVRLLLVGGEQRDWDLANAAFGDELTLERTRDAESALVRMREARYDIVLSHLSLPQLSGLDLLERIIRDHPGVDFIVACKENADERVMAAFRLGASGRIGTPFAAAELTNVVRRVVEHRKLVLSNAWLTSLSETMEACRTLIPCVEVGYVYARGLEILLKGTGCSRGLALYHRGPMVLSDGLVLRGFPEEFANRLRVAIIDGKRATVQATKTQVEVLEKAPLHGVVRELGYDLSGKMLMAPVPSMGEAAQGVFWVFGENCEFGEDFLASAQVVVDHTVLALENAEKYVHAKERAFIDDVTGLYNARYLYTASENELSRSERYGSELTFLFLDLDRFKLVNDNYGHLVGSRTLHRLGQIFASCVRQVDMVARYGGDEFTILLSDTNHEGGMQVAERICEAVERAEFDSGSDVPMRLTISIGVATYPQHGATRESLLEAADKAMYHAKFMGRNRVSSFSEVGLRN